MRTLLAKAPLASGEVVIEGDEAHHGRTVLRLRCGDGVRLADGHGRLGEGVVTAVDRSAVRIQVSGIVESPHLALEQVTVAVAAPKGDRFTDLVRGLTELGVGAILPLVCERSEQAPRLDRPRRIAAEALKQCRRSWLPTLGPVVDLSTLETLPGRRIVLDPAGAPANPGRPSPTVLIVGPEGGFTCDELAGLQASPCESVRLAGAILRIETAALSAAAVWSAAWEGGMTP